MHFAPNPEARALGVASLQAALFGSLLSHFMIVAGLVSSGKAASILSSFGDGDLSTQITFADQLWSGVFLGLVFLPAALLFGLVFGTIAVGAALTALGFPIAIMLRRLLATPYGLSVAIATATLVTACLATFVFTNMIGLIVLAYALPAGICYWRQIRLEEACD